MSQAVIRIDNQDPSTSVVLLYRKKGDSIWLEKLVKTGADRVVLTGMAYNVLYEFKLRSSCRGRVTESLIKEIGSIACASVTITPGITSAKIEINHPAHTQISSYELVFSDETASGFIIESPGAAAKVIKRTVTGLTPATDYGTLVLIITLGSVTKQCPGPRLITKPDPDNPITTCVGPSDPVILYFSDVMPCVTPDTFSIVVV
jgi:hypothetical protein